MAAYGERDGRHYTGYGEQYGNQYAEVRETQKDGVGSQICGSICCSLIGICMFFSALALLAHNEKSTVCVAKALHAAYGRYVTIGCDTEARQGEPDPVYISCPLNADSLPAWNPQSFGADWLSGAFETRAVKMKLAVEMYQCKEKKESNKVKGRDNKDTIVDTWTYQRTWSNEHIHSDKFKAWANDEARRAMETGCGRGFRGNPAFPIFSQELAAQSLQAGAHDVSRHLSKIAVTSPVQLVRGSYQLPSAFGGSDTEFVSKRIARDARRYTRGQFIDYYGHEKVLTEWDNARPVGDASEVDATIVSNTVHTCGQGSVSIGCLKLSFYQSSTQHISLVAGASDSGPTRPWTAPSSWMCSSSSSSNQVELFAEGAKPAQVLFDDAQSSNATMVWILRLLGMGMSVMGIYCFLQPIQTIANLVDQFFDWFRIIPILGPLLDFLGDVVAGAVGCAIGMVSFGIGLPFAFATISISWCVMRPLVGVPMLVGSVVFLVMTIRSMIQYAKEGRSKRKRE